MSRIIKYIVSPSLCCADEWKMVESSRYDLERLGFYHTDTPEEAALLVIQGAVSPAVREWVDKVYAVMKDHKKVIATGACAVGGGLFPGCQVMGINVDAYVPGCPPRPEALIDGLLLLYPENHPLSKSREAV